MALKNRYLGIKFPFSDDNQNGLYLDLETENKELVKSNLRHLIFTRKGERLRMPDFGTNLLNFIFEQKDGMTVVQIEMEIKESVKKYIPNVNITNLSITETEPNLGEENSYGYKVVIDYYITDLKVEDRIEAAI